MKPGRELDALIAEKVMGLKPCTDPIGRCDGAHMRPVQCWGTGGGGSDLKNYSEDIAAAWEVLGKMGCNTKALFYHDVYVQWECKLDSQRRAFYDCRISAFGETAPHAICLAALKAVGHAI